MKLNKGEQRSLGFFLICLSLAALVNVPKLIGSSSAEEEAEAISRAKARELAFIKKQADYFSEHGRTKSYDPRTGKVTE